MYNILLANSALYLYFDRALRMGLIDIMEDGWNFCRAFTHFFQLIEINGFKDIRLMYPIHNKVSNKKTLYRGTKYLQYMIYCETANFHVLVILTNFTNEKNSIKLQLVKVSSQNCQKTKLGDNR